MKIIVENLDNLKLRGVYKIYCIENNKYYIGSTSKTFKQRFTQHASKLKNNKHACAHLQNAYNKYGEDSFEFSIIESIEEISIILEREKFWIDDLNACDNTIGFNTNPNPEESAATCNVVKEKIRDTLKEKYKDGVPHLKEHEFKKGHTPWSKGKKIEDTSNYHTKKTITEKVLKARKESAEKRRESGDYLEILDKNMNSLGFSRSISDLHEWSQTEDNDLPIRVFNGSKALTKSRIGKAIREQSMYKNIYIRRVPNEGQPLLENRMNSGNAEMPILSQESDTSD